MITIKKMAIDDSIILRPRRMKTVGLLLVRFGFTAGGAFMVRQGEWMGWLPLGFFGLGSLVFFGMLLPNFAYLQISPEGLTMRSCYRSHTFRWSDVQEFGVDYIGPNRMVVFNFSPSYSAQKRGRELSAAMTGYEGAVADDIYGVPLEELAALMNEYRSRYLREKAARQDFRTDEGGEAVQS